MSHPDSGLHIRVSDGRQNPGININIRGIQGQGRNNVMVDGTRQNAARYGGYAGINSAVYVDPELIAEISVEKGPSGGVHGAGAIGGVVNMRTLEARDLIKPGREAGGQVRGSFSDNDASTPGVASLAGALRLNDNLDITAAVSRRHMADYTSGTRNADPRMLEPPSIFSPAPIQPGDDVPNTAQKTESALLKARLHFGSGHHLSLGATHYESQYTYDNRLGSAASGMFYDAIETTAHSVSAKYGWQPEADLLFDLQANLWQASTQDRGDSPGMPGYHDRQLDTWGFELHNTSRFTRPWLEATFKYGGEWFEDDGKKSDVQGKRQIGGFFTQATLLPRPWLQADLSARHDSYTIQGSGSAQGSLQGQNSYPFVLDRGASRHNPGAALTFIPLEGLRLYARYSEGFRPPTMTENMMSGTAFVTPIQPNLDLRAEIARNREYGINFLQRGLLISQDGLGLRLARFDNRYTDYINRRYSGGGLTTTPLVLTFVNLDHARFTGWELQARYDAGLAFLEINRTEFDRIVFCHQGNCSGQVGNDGDFGAAFLPPGAKTVAGLGIRLPGPRIVLGARMRHDDKVMEVATENDYSGQRWAPYRLYDLYGHYGITPDLRLSFSVENITDQYYVDANAGWRRVASPGRSLTASFQYTF